MTTMSVTKIRAIVERLNIQYTISVPENILFRHIMIEMDDAAPRTVREVTKSIHRLGYMKPTNIGVWEFAGEFAPLAVVKEAIAADDTALADREVIE